MCFQLIACVRYLTDRVIVKCLANVTPDAATPVTTSLHRPASNHSLSERRPSKKHNSSGPNNSNTALVASLPFVARSYGPSPLLACCSSLQGGGGTSLGLSITESVYEIDNGCCCAFLLSARRGKRHTHARVVRSQNLPREDACAITAPCMRVCARQSKRTVCARVYLCVHVRTYNTIQCNKTVLILGKELQLSAFDK